MLPVYWTRACGFPAGQCGDGTPSLTHTVKVGLQPCTPLTRAGWVHRPRAPGISTFGHRQRSHRHAEDDASRADCAAERAVRTDRARGARTRTGARPDPSGSLRNVSQRCVREGRRVSRTHIAAHSGARDRRTHRQDRAQRDRVEEGRSGGRGLARRARFRLQRVPQGTLHQLRKGADHRHHLRRRLRRICGRAA